MEFSAYTQTSDTLQARIKDISNRRIDDKPKVLRDLFSFLDLTTLEATDHTARIRTFCSQALEYHSKGLTVAAVCVYMPFIGICREMLQHTDILIATVSNSFPSGQLPLHLKLEEVRWAVEQGADEIDMVINRGKMLEAAYDDVFTEIRETKKACGQARLKVILETGELGDPLIIRKASELALLAGADFLKTSTGKVQPAATPEAAVVMLDTIQEYFQATGKQVGFKPAGGISDAETALLYYKLVDHILGNEWLCPQLFRIGASRLASKLNELIP